MISGKSMGHRDLIEKVRLSKALSGEVFHDTCSDNLKNSEER